MKGKKTIGVATTFVVISALITTMLLSKAPENMLAFKPGPSYLGDWAVVDSLIGAGLPKEALNKVTAIRAQATATTNYAQIIKSLLYNESLKNETDENYMENVITETEQVMNTAPYPVKPVLQSILAQLYQNYYQRSEYLIDERTAVTGNTSADITTWDAAMFHRRVVELYLASVSQADSLQRTDLNVFNDILIQAPGSKTYRSTLYDFLANRAFDFFAYSGNNGTLPANTFVMDDVDFWGNASTFTGISINTADTFSLLPVAVKLMQNLVAFNNAKGNTNALVDLELNRLGFVYHNYTGAGKDSLYLQSLKNIEQQYITDTISALAGFEIARQLNSMGDKYTPQQPEYRWMKKLALEKCNEVHKRFPYTSGGSNCALLGTQIAAPNISFKIEDVNVPGQPFKMALTYTNTDSVYLRIIDATMLSDEMRRNLSDDEILKKIIAGSFINQWSTPLPAFEDYQQHIAEVALPAQQAGKYYVVVSASRGFNTLHTPVAYKFIQVSALGYTTRATENGDEFWVYNRMNGQPVKGAKVAAYNQEYNQIKRDYADVLKGTCITNAEGFAYMPRHNTYDSHSIKIEYGNDHMQSLSDEYFYYTPQDDNSWQERVSFFLDRAIYRPGQTLYFKGLCVSSKGDKSKIEKGVNKTIELYDVNGQKVNEIKVTTNDYGTFAGSFVLPSTGLNGQMRIATKDEKGAINFRVEDYKRPQFEVTFEPLKGSFRIGDKVFAKGKAQGYSGVPVNGAVVKYHVTREASFPYRFSWFKLPRTNSTEIFSGEVATNDTGGFKLDFIALPDPTVNKADLPEYSYAIKVDVTDVNGETESGNTGLHVGSVALRADIEMPESYSTSDTTAARIETKNLNGEFEAATGTIQVYRLKDYDRLLRSRPWDEPDQFTMSEADFHKKFPLDIYKDEDHDELREKEFKLMDFAFNSEKDKSFYLRGLANWKQGRYLAELTTHDKFGTEVKVKKYFTVYNLQQKAMPLKQLWWLQPVKVYAEPGDTAKVLIGSSEKDVLVRYEVALKGKIIHTEWIKLNNEKKLIEMPVTEEYQGNLAMNFTLFKDNRSFNQLVFIEVPFSNKELKMEFSTFRDKLLPGAQEQWRVKISGPQGEKVAAEMLATMYDASLDAFAANTYHFSFYDYYHYYDNQRLIWGNGGPYSNGESWSPYSVPGSGETYRFPVYDNLNLFLLNNIASNRRNYRRGDVQDYTYEWGYGGGGVRPTNGVAEVYKRKVRRGSVDLKFTDNLEASTGTYTVTSANVSFRGAVAADAPPPPPPPPPGQPVATAPLLPRTNFNETVFFYPQLHTDSAGNIEFSFTVPEALTRWKFQGIAHTHDLKMGYLTANTVTQKDLMVNTNAPRFLREGDEITFTARISSLSDKSLNGKAVLTFSDPYTGRDVTTLLGNDITPANFTVKSGQNTSVSWKLKVPEGLGVVAYRIMATAGNFSDGEEAPLPVLSNRMLVTETMPIHIKGGEHKTFTLEKLVHAPDSKTLTNHRLTFELTSNPAWYAIQALPYMMEFPHECSEQLFNRYYANSLATHIANASPRIKQVFDSWKGTDALKSNLEKNSGLKQILLEESPWVLQGRNETERKNRLGLLFNLNKMSNEQAKAIKKLLQNQSVNGGWPWFKGMPDNRYITQYIVTGLGRLQSMGVTDIKKNAGLNQALHAAISYLDQRIAEDYNNLIKYKADLSKQQIGEFEIQYLYARSFFKDIPVLSGSTQAYNYYMEQAQKFWLNQSKPGQAMAAIVLYRKGNTDAYQKIIRSLDEYATKNEELGMYWKDNVPGYLCFEAPVETQALMIEAFSLDGAHQDAVDELRTWLLTQKQTQDWKTTKATSDACYALLLNGTDWLSSTEVPDVTIGNVALSAMPNLPKAESGTGYIRTSWEAKEIKPEMGKVTISKQNKGISWGALYWQYFEQLDKITGAKTPLQLNKKLYLQTNGPAGPLLTPITGNTVLKTGDLVKVRIELRVDRDMDFVQMKDMRAAGFEPVSVLSACKYQGGLGYYESPRDASTNFFFDHLPKGTFVFEYGLRVSQKGNFSNGITTIQSMYAPEFSSHSEGGRVTIN